MRFTLRTLLFPAFLSAVLVAGTAACGEETPLPPCSPRMLDINVVTPSETANGLNGHWLAVEFRNRSQKACHLVEPLLKFPPDNQQQIGFSWAPDTSQAAHAFKDKSNRIGANEVAHFLLAWSSLTLHPAGLVVDDCATHDDVTLSWGNINVLDLKPFLEIRHVWMQSCDQFWLSSMRMGPYVNSESVAKEWSDRVGLNASAFAALNSVQDLRPGDVELRALSDVEYLKGSFETGYSGYFELFLKSSSPAFANCSFHILAKREADGQTVAHMNHCDSRGATPAEAKESTKEIRLVIREMGLLPERVGRVEYEVVSEVLQDGAHAFAQAKTQLSIRDPKQPMLPAIETNIPDCQISQLKLTTPPVELGTHWRTPRAYAPPGDEWQDGKVFEVTNVSDKNCLLGGVPALKFLNPPEITTGLLLPPVCRNCATSLFRPRESRWIELKPMDSAHFMAARTVLDPDYWVRCTVIGGLELTLPGGKETMSLPFEAGSCNPVSVTAWRADRYDKDPLNIQYENYERRREQRRLAASPPLPNECAKTVSSDTGVPVMFPSPGKVKWGLSSRPTPYVGGTPVLLWLYNPTDEPQPVMTCADIDWFWSSGFKVFDSAGQRVLSREEEKRRNESRSGTQLVYGCSRNFPIDIPPHTCSHATFSAPAYDFARDLQRYYSLPPATYFVVPGATGPDHAPVTHLTEPVIGVVVTVLQE